MKKVQNNFKETFGLAQVTLFTSLRSCFGLLRSTTAYVFHRGYGVSTNCCNYRMVISQRHSTKTLTGLQNKTKHPTRENKQITEIVGSYEIILLLSVMIMVCYESGLF